MLNSLDSRFQKNSTKDKFAIASIESSTWMIYARHNKHHSLRTIVVPVKKTQTGYESTTRSSWCSYFNHHHNSSRKNTTNGILSRTTLVYLQKLLPSSRSPLLTFRSYIILSSPYLSFCLPPAFNVINKAGWMGWVSLVFLLCYCTDVM